MNDASSFDWNAGNVETLKAMLADGHSSGRGKKTGSNTTRLGRGTAYILARLDRDGFTELATKVRAGNLSANAAAIEAGFRKKPVKRCPHCGHEW